MIGSSNTGLALDAAVLNACSRSKVQMKVHQSRPDGMNHHTDTTFKIFNFKSCKRAVVHSFFESLFNRLNEFSLELFRPLI